MANYVKVNGKQHEAWSQHVKVNGAWHKCQQFIKVNGLWRKVYSPEINAEDVVGFKVVYKLCSTDMTHPDFPNLKVNYNLPVEFDLTGASKGISDTSEKGVVLEYKHDIPDMEGIIMWEANLYAVLKNGVLINIGRSKPLGSEDERITKEESREYESWSTDKLSIYSITMQGYLIHESYGYFTAGWNSLFQTENCIDPTIYETNKLTTYRKLLESYNLLPIENRDNIWNATAKIGIARDMTSKWHNMVGSHGKFDQTIQSIWLNGIEKPFVIEIAD